MTWIFRLYFVGLAKFFVISILEIIIQKSEEQNENDSNYGERLKFYITVMITLIIVGFMRYQSSDTIHINSQRLVLM